MPTPVYTLRTDLTPHPWCVVLDDASFRRPCLVRVLWRPSAPQAGILVPDWIAGQPATALRNYDKGGTTRWHVRATTYGFRDVELETVREGDRVTLGDIAPPRTRTLGRWFTWECGRWVDKPNHQHGLACFARARAEYWHTPPYAGAGTDMTPLPPTDPTYADQKAKP